MTLSKAVSLAAAVLAVSTLTARADVEMLDCEGAIITMSKDAAATSQEKAGSMAAWSQNVCAVVKDLPLDDYRQATRVSIDLPAYEVETTIVVFPHSDPDH